MPVDLARYRRWEGQARPGRGAIWTIAGTMARRLQRQRLVRWLTLFVPLAACLMAGAVYLLWNQGKAEPRIMQMIEQTQGTGLDLFTIMNRYFHESVGFFALLLAAITGAPLIADDRRVRALPLYFSRPITHFDYLVGKLLTVLLFLSLLLVAPVLLLYALELSFARTGADAWAQLGTLGRSLTVSVALAVVLSAVSLGVSSLVERGNVAVLALFGLALGVNVMAQLCARRIFDDGAWLALSPLRAVERLSNELLALPPQLERGNRLLRQMPVATAWLSLGLWTLAGLATVTIKVRRVEVVT